MSTYQCNGTENKFWLSHICTNGSDTTGFECYNIQDYRRVLQISDSNTKAILGKREKKMIWTVFILIMLNIICWLPYQLFNALIYDVIGDDFQRFYYDIFYALNFTQFCLNFFVYIARSTQYRKAFRYYLLHLKSKYKMY